MWSESRVGVPISLYTVARPLFLIHVCGHCSQGGLSRKYFEPLIDLVESTMAVQRIGSGLDYRSSPGTAPTDGATATATTGARTGPVPDALEAAWQSLGAAHHQAARVRAGPLILAPASPGAADSAHAMRSAWNAAVGRHRQVQSHRLPVSYGRSLLISSAAALGPPSTAGRQVASGAASGADGGADRAADLPPRMMAFFTFAQLCGIEGLRDPGSPVGTVLGPSDYLALCR